MTVPPADLPTGALKGAKFDPAAWSAAVGDVVQSVKAQERGPGREWIRGKSPNSTIALCMVTLLALVGYNAWYFTRSVETLEADAFHSAMIERVALIATEAEAFRRKTGALPQATDLGGLLRDGMSYSVTGEHFRIGFGDEGPKMSYHSSVELELWQTNSRQSP